MTNEETVRRFFEDRSKTRREGRVGREFRNSTGSIYSRGDVLYSYGEHYPLAVVERNRHGYAAVAYVNRDKYSITTANHRKLVERFAREYIGLHPVVATGERLAAVAPFVAGLTEVPQ